MSEETSEVRTILIAVDEVRLGGQSGSSQRRALRVRAFRKADQSRPAKNVGVLYRVVHGPVALSGGERSGPVEVRTDDRGEATIDLQLVESGYALVAAELKKDPDQRVFFETVTEGVVDRLTVWCQPPLGEPGTFGAEISAVDFRGDPVEGASLLFEAQMGLTQGIEGAVAERGAGRYEGKVEILRSGCWELVAQDDLTRTSAHTCLRVVPGDPHGIRFVGEVDPRRQEPYDRVTLRARLEDGRGNALDPSRLSCRTLDGESIPVVPVGEEAQATVRAAGYTTVPVVFEDPESNLQEEITVLFSAVWFSDPGPVFAGDTFRHTLYLIPPPDRPADHATVEVEFDPKLVAFESFEPFSHSGPTFHSKAAVHDKLLTIELEGPHAITAEEYPTGVPIGEVTWVCQGEGKFCFSAVARMSPSTPPWKQCPEQKKRDTRKVCLNIIYEGAKAAYKAIGTTIANTAENLIGSADNVSRCCPILDLDVHYETIGDILIKGAIGADGAVTTSTGRNGDFQKLFRALRGMPNTVIKDKCINMVLVPINIGGVGGLTLPGPPGDSVVDPVALGNLTGQAGAHELGHALGLSAADGLADINDPTNLMHKQLPVGTKLSPEQCKKIQETLGSYS
jgi:hypothetical protein